MANIPYHNATGKFVHVGGKSIAPGETRVVDETLLGRRPESADFADLDEDLSNDSLTALLGKSVKDIAAAVPDLDDEQLAELYRREENGSQPRKGVLKAVDQERMDRAANAMTGGDESDQPADGDETQTDGEKPANKEAGGDE